MEGLSLIVPAHNSESVIKASVEEYYKTFSKKFKNIEIIVVCNGCDDNTYQVCRDLKSKIPINAIEIPERGKGYALTKGFKESKFNIMGFLDADNPFDLTKVINLVDHLETHQIAIVSKYLKGKKKKQEYLLRRLISLGGNFFSKTILGLHFRDTQAGAKFFKREVWEKIKDPHFICIGFDWDMEFLYKVKKEKFKIAEVYIHVNPEKFSTVRLKYLIGMVFRLLRLRLR